MESLEASLGQAFYMYEFIRTETDKEETIIGMDFIVLAMGAKSVDVLSNEIKDSVPEVYVIGDAKLACRALEAIADGAQIGRQI